MALEITWLVGVLLLNAILGMLLVLGVFSFMERNVPLGAVGGILVGSALIYAQATLGERVFVASVEEMKLLVIAAALGAVLGVVGTVMTIEPEL